MKVIKAIIKGFILIPPSNEPYKSTTVRVDMIEKFYEEGGFDIEMNCRYGLSESEGFFDELPKDCEVILDFTTRVKNDEYYDEMSFKNACYNKTLDNPYQLPKWTDI